MLHDFSDYDKSHIAKRNVLEGRLKKNKRSKTVHIVDQGSEMINDDLAPDF